MQIQTGPFAAKHLVKFTAKMFHLFTFILEGQFLVPQKANRQKGELSQLKNWMRQRDFRAWGINPGPF